MHGRPLYHGSCVPRPAPGPHPDPRVRDRCRPGGGATVAAYLTGGGWFALAVAVAGLPIGSAIFLAVAGTTPGKAAVGLRVVGTDGGRPPFAVLRRELWGRLVLEHGLMFVGGAGAVATAPADRPPPPLARRGRRHARHPRTHVSFARPLAPPYAPADRLGPAGLTLAPLLPRLAAYLIDLGLVVTVWGALFVPLAIFTGQIDTDSDQQEVSGAFGLAAAATVVLIAGLYAAVAIWLRETTVGKHAVGLAVRRVDGSRVSFGRALLREVVARQLLFGRPARSSAGCRSCSTCCSRSGTTAGSRCTTRWRAPSSSAPRRASGPVLTRRHRSPKLTGDDVPRFRGGGAPTGEMSAAFRCL